jgi:DNA-binding response OmpR family regulator
MTPRILLVEDDPVSRSFLQAAATALPADVDAAESCAEAVQCAGQHAYDLWLIDANLPDGLGADLLATLRLMSPTTPALAHTASEARNDHEALLAAGFIDVLVKPIAVLELQTTICRVLGFDRANVDGEPRPCARLPDWDDVTALAALKGEQEHVSALRQLFLDELSRQRDAVVAALDQNDAAGARRTLHMLRASCGFVGALRLDDAVRALEVDPQSEFALARFQLAVDDLLPEATRTA